MKRSLADLTTHTFDLLVIGGGITGASLALDAAMRGMSVALVEKGDFGAATSSASSKLLHGGIRYLQQGLVHKVRESAMERACFQRLAPHLLQYVPFVIPTYREWRKGRTLLGTAMAAYRFLCMGENGSNRDSARQVPPWRWIGREDLREILPGWPLEKATGGVVFHECHMQNSERMTLAFLETAVRHGAVIANYLRADSFVMERQRVKGIRGRDILTGQTMEIRAQVVANAAGPWIPDLNRSLAGEEITGIVKGYSKGAHIVARPLTGGHAVAIPTPRRNQALLNRGGRHVFIIPWRGHSLIGTTYGPYYGDLNEVGPREEDILELIADINQGGGSPLLALSDVRHAFAGIYPLVEDSILPQVYQGTGRYQVVDHKYKDGVDGLFSVFGAKFITARRLAEKALDQIVPRFSRRFAPCRTAESTLDSGKIENMESFRADCLSRYGKVVPPATVSHLVTHYGTKIEGIMALIEKEPVLGRPVAPHLPITAAEVVHAVREEMACRLEDVLFRRTGLGTLGNPGEGALRSCADLMGGILRWDRRTRDAEISRTRGRFLP